MKINSLFAGRFALTGVALAAMLLSAADVWALGLGRMAVQSSLGETLRAEIDVSSMTPDEESGLQVRVATPEAYRAAGVDYNAVLPGTRVVLMRRPDGRPFLRVTGDRSVQEPFVDVILELSWPTGRLVREYTMLFDPVSRSAAPAPAAAPAQAITPSISPAPAAATKPSRAERRSAQPKASSAEPVESRSTAPRTADASGDEYKVRPGDTLYRIASRTQRPGVSLDQMLVSLYQANPDAFARQNMNRLKSGVVLTVPSAESAKAMPTAEARQTIQAQSADFGAYRQRLAGSVPTAKTEGAPRQASGKVQSSVDDRKQSGATTPDKLTLSKGAAAKASAPEARLSKEREKKDASARLAELSKNVEDLKKLSGTGGASAPAKPVPGIAVPAAAPAVVVKPAPASAAVQPAPTAAVKPAASVPAPAQVAAASTPVPVSVALPASIPAPVASVPAVIAASVPLDVAPASAPAQVASAASTPASTAVIVPAPQSAAEEESSLSSLVADNPIALAAGGGLLALLLGFGVYRFTKRGRKDSGETSFLESRLQPDSFFGASGGQRIDTRDASGASSSMSYSLSQLDAIGDVDPVAEADVYLAYGRDLQAEEILKEAMRASPERLAIRTKLLEVYAKRRDTKGFELLATQLFGLTGGKGEDWERAQEIGLTIDPEHPLYQPGGAPSLGEGDARPSAELLGASTMPQSVLPSPPEFGASRAPTSGFDSTSSSSFDLDLDLDQLDSLPPQEPFASSEATQPLPAIQVQAPEPEGMSFDLPIEPRPARVDAATPMEFDLSSITLDLGNTTVVQTPAPAAAAAAAPNLADIDLADAVDDNADPIARKLELAEEFRQIGDMEGARDLLQEVVAKSSGSIQSRAKKMLDELG